MKRNKNKAYQDYVTWGRRIVRARFRKLGKQAGQKSFDDLIAKGCSVDMAIELMAGNSIKDYIEPSKPWPRLPFFDFNWSYSMPTGALIRLNPRLLK